jgi:hypothetical protein
MKTYIIPAAIAILIVTGCSTTKTSVEYDDVYASGKQPTKSVKTVKSSVDQTVEPDYFVKNETISSDYVTEDYEAGQYVYYGDEPYYTEMETQQSSGGTTYITNNYYGDAGIDHYNYSYAARFSRFYDPFFGFGYYSPFYTGFYYSPWWYYDPFWYRPSFYFCMGWGWGSFGWGFPYYPYYWYPYSSYWYGYNRGYWDGYYGYNYYGSGYNNYYGHRSNMGSTNSPGGSSGRFRTSEPLGRNDALGRIERESSSGSTVTGKTSEITGRTGALNAEPQTRQGETTRQVAGQTGVPANIGESRETNAQTRNVVTESGSRTSEVAASKVQSDGRTQSSGSPQSRYTYKKPDESTSKTQTYRPGQGISSDGQTQRTEPSQRYQKPSDQNSVERSNPVRQGSSAGNTQVYSKPQQNTRNTYSRPAQSNVNRSYSQPSGSNTQSTQPARSNQRVAPQSSGTTTRSYSPPSDTRSSGSYTAPSGSGGSTYSAPASSGRSTYSTPSSSGSSAPSRSSSGSGSSSGSSGGSRGTRR